MNLLSVVMPVKDALPHLDAAVTSILKQSYTDFELIIGNDGSVDGSGERLRHWAAQDSRIRLMESPTPQGPVRSSNWVANAARTPLVARMDADDIAHPDRLRRQVEVLEAHPEAVLTAPLFEAIDDNGALTRRSDRGRLLRPEGGPPIAHGSIMYRRAAFEAAGGYAADSDYYEDLDLYDRIAAQGAILIILEPLYRYRFSSCSARLNADRDKIERILDVYMRSHGLGPHRSVSGSKGRVSPEALKALGSLRLWSGKRPGVLRAMLERGDLAWDRASLKVLAWALWGEASPATLRAALRLTSSWRSRQAQRRLADLDLYEWRPTLPARAG